MSDHITYLDIVPESSLIQGKEILPGVTYLGTLGECQNCDSICFTTVKDFELGEIRICGPECYQEQVGNPNADLYTPGID
jgi:hypothetical protein